MLTARRIACGILFLTLIFMFAHTTSAGVYDRPGTKTCPPCKKDYFCSKFTGTCEYDAPVFARGG